MTEQEMIEELLQYDRERVALQRKWADNPPPAGYIRHEGYYGCGGLIRDDGHSPLICGCGYEQLRLAKIYEA